MAPRALSVRQPWAWAIIHAGKDIENRSHHAVAKGAMSQGRILIHASKGMTRYEYESARDFMTSIGVDCPRPDALIRGAVLGSVDVVDVVKESNSPWFFGPRGLVLENISPLPVPVAGPGALGYFDWRPAGEIDPPKPWMLGWPGKPSKRPEVRTAPLFGSDV